LENESLKHRLDSYEDTSKLSMANLSSMLSEKGRDMNDMKWKLNDALELKRRSETDKETMQFELENLRARYVADLKEKYIKVTEETLDSHSSRETSKTQWI
jgi:hypothetical protein